jgi:protein-S-isoprenylcysteine O-methyltransferase Ste14
MTISYILLILLWLVYFSLHSLLARAWVKDWVSTQVPGLLSYYRLLYNLVALIGLILIFYFSLKISGQRWYAPTTAVRFAALALASWGLILIRLSFKQYNLKEFMGLSREAEKPGRLKTGGLLKQIRHPLYAGLILIIIGFWLYVPTTVNLITAMMAIVYIQVGIRFEERSLVDRYGKDYLKYKKRVPMLVPDYLSFWKKKR